MSAHSWRTALVLGGTRSGKSAFAEALVGGAATVRYLATGPTPDDADAQWQERVATHRSRRPQTWTVEEVAASPGGLAELITAADPADTLLVDDLGGWLSALLLDEERSPAESFAPLLAALADSSARVVLVSPEVGLSLVSMTPLGRRFTDLLGELNHAAADVCDAAVLVVAGQPVSLKHGDQLVPAAPAVRPTALSTPVPTAATSSVLAAVAGFTLGDTDHPVLDPALTFPAIDDIAGINATDQLTAATLPGIGLGGLSHAVAFAAATQGTPEPQPWRQPWLLLVHGAYEGAGAAGETPAAAAELAAATGRGEGALAVLGAGVGATLMVVPAPTAAALDAGPSLSEEETRTAMATGAYAVDQAVDGGADVIVLGACGAGADTAATAVLAAVTHVETAAVLPLVVVDGIVDDNAWMQRCAAVRDALHRTRGSNPDLTALVTELGGGVVATALGVLLAAAIRRVPVVVDGPVGVAAAAAAQQWAPTACGWLVIPDLGTGALVKHASTLLRATPMVQLGLQLGEGATGLAALGPIMAAQRLAAGQAR